MSLWRQVTRGWRVLRHRSDADRELSEEVTHFVEQAALELQARGLSREAALREARAAVGSQSAIRDQVRSVGWEETSARLAPTCGMPFACWGRPGCSPQSPS